jgi:hypothetical protein
MSADMSHSDAREPCLQFLLLHSCFLNRDSDCEKEDFETGERISFHTPFFSHRVCGESANVYFSTGGGRFDHFLEGDMKSHTRSFASGSCFASQSINKSGL